MGKTKSQTQIEHWAKMMQMYQFMCDYMRENYQAPSTRELRDNLGISSLSIVNYRLNRMVEEGLIMQREEGRARSYIPLGVTISTPPLKMHAEIVE